MCGEVVGADEIDFSNREALAESPSDDGTITLAWDKADESVVVVVEQDTSSEFESPLLRYEGPDSATVLSGFRDGAYYFRIRESGSDDWSEPLRIRVEYIGRSRLFFLLATGGLVVLATAGAIVGGYLHTREKEGES